MRKGTKSGGTLKPGDQKLTITVLAGMVALTAIVALMLSCGDGSGGESRGDTEVWDMGIATVISGEPEGSTDGNAASKGRLLSLIYPAGEGFERVLLAFYVDAAGPLVKDLWGNAHHAQDLFVTRSEDRGQTWSTPVNLSLSASRSSLITDHDGDAETPDVPYHGDVEKPVVYGNGKEALVLWLSKYCPGDVQGSVTYKDAGMLEIPFSCVYAARTVDGGLTWGTPEQLTDGLRDAKFIMGHATKVGFAIAWQEDPRGLQPGEAEGPGEGGSGAKVSHGTDIWYTSLATKALAAGTPLPAPGRITDNFSVIDADGYESGSTGASRPNVTLVGTGVVIAYEETKGTGGEITGKYIRYHAFPDFTDVTVDPTEGRGWIISDPLENARRVRVFGQGSAGEISGARIVFLWRQGEYDQGGPADIMARVGLKRSGESGSTGFRPEDLAPAVAEGCEEPALAALNEPPLNLSSHRGINAASGDDFLEDARAHRGFIRGDTVIVGFGRTPDWAVARYTNHENYNFYITRSTDGGTTWERPANISNISDKTLSMREPRIVPTPDSPDPAEERDTNTFLVAWTTEVNQYDYLSKGAIDLDVFFTRSTNGGATYEPVRALANMPVHEGECQAKLTPDGTRFFTVWVQTSDDGVGDVVFRSCSGRIR